jgi:hypothetical protein
VATLGRGVLIDISTNTTTIAAALEDGSIAVDGDAAALHAVFGHVDSLQSMFAVVEPLRTRLASGHLAPGAQDGFG